jgi:LGFP repeat
MNVNGQRVFTALMLGARPPDDELYGQDVLTQHNDNSRTGAYLVETQLTPANVTSPSFGRLCTRNVDGDTVSQPLYMRAVHTATAGIKNLFFVTTSKNNIYAFDSDDLNPNPAHGLVWQRNLCSSLPTGVCGETWSHLVGITSTPVIDPNTETMYVVARCSDPAGGANDGAIFIHSINLADGSDRVAPVQILATDPTNPSVKFDFHCQRNRPGLLLSAGVVYAAFATFSCDAGCAQAPYHGWVLGYQASDLKQVAVFDTSPHQGGAGIWQTGKGLAGADDGSIYFETGNGPASEPLQDSFVKLQLAPPPAGLALAGSFAPNDAVTLTNGDTDLGSGGPLLLPDSRLIGGGKQGRYYVLDQGNMTLTQDSALDALGYNGFQAFINSYHNDNTKASCPAAGSAAGCDPTAAGHACYIDPKRYANGELCGPNIHGGPIFWEPNTSFGLIYEMPQKDFLKAFKYDLTTHIVTEAPFLTAAGSLAKPPTDGMPGGFSSLSADKASNGIVWTSMPVGDGQWNPVPGRLAAFDASDLKQLWSDDDNVLFAKSVPPTIADGKVIRATAANQVIVYGLLKPGASLGTIPTPHPLCHSIEQKHANYGGEVGLLGSPTGPESSTGDQAGGKYRNYRGSVFGMAHTILSLKGRAGAPLPTCSVPVGESTTLDSSLYWSPLTCAHVVQGQIRELWLQLGGVKGKLGYPIGDETLTPDQLGRMSAFEHGEIWWYPEKGAYVHEKRDGNAE